MKKPKLALQLLNLINGLLLVTYLFQIMHWPFFLPPIKLMYIIIAAFITFGAKSWIEVKYNISDPIKTNKTTNTIFFIGAGGFVVGILLKVMHWPFGSIALIIGVSTLILAFMLSFILDPDEEDQDPEILDDF